MKGKIKITKGKKLFICVFLLLLMVIYIWYENNTIKVTEISVHSVDLPSSFDGFKIAHISDFHDVEFGDENEKLLEKLEEIDPDIIALTGDMIDRNRVNIELTIEFVKKAVLVAPCYYVNGNHEASMPKEDYERLETSLLELGVNVLRNQSSVIEKNGEYVSVLGIDDLDFSLKTNISPTSHMSAENIKSLSDSDGYKILLSHRPEYFDNYVKGEMNLVLSGHAHGGQFRIPFVGGVVAPGQGFFPEYDSGLYSEGKTNMIVSRGLGNSVVPIRINNRPEIVTIVLEKK